MRLFKSGVKRVEDPALHYFGRFPAPAGTHQMSYSLQIIQELLGPLLVGRAARGSIPELSG
jgi:hypothetical protein